MPKQASISSFFKPKNGTQTSTRTVSDKVKNVEKKKTEEKAKKSEEKENLAKAMQSVQIENTEEPKKRRVVLDSDSDEELQPSKERVDLVIKSQIEAVETNTWLVGPSKVIFLSLQDCPIQKNLMKVQWLIQIREF